MIKFALDFKYLSVDSLNNAINSIKEEINEFLDTVDFSKYPSSAEHQFKIEIHNVSYFTHARNGKFDSFGNKEDALSYLKQLVEYTVIERYQRMLKEKLDESDEVIEAIMEELNCESIENYYIQGQLLEAVIIGYNLKR